MALPHHKFLPLGDFVSTLKSAMGSACSTARVAPSGSSGQGSSLRPSFGSSAGSSRLHSCGLPFDGPKRDFDDNDVCIPVREGWEELRPEVVESECARYVLQGELGHGAFGVVHRATVRDTGEAVAIKVVRCQSLVEADRAMEEARVLIRTRHAHVVECKGFFLNGFDVWLVLELFEGGDMSAFLADLHKSRRKVLEAVVRRWAFQLLLALKHLHVRGIIHRDIKTKNIFLSKDLRVVKLGDFGLAKRLAKEPDHLAATVAGTPFFMAPEMLDEAKYAAPIDVWALGCILVAMCVPKAYLRSRGLFCVVALMGPDKRERLSAELLRFGYTPALVALINRLLVADPVARPTAAEVLNDPYFKPLYDAHTGAVIRTTPSPGDVPSTRLDATDMRREDSNVSVGGEFAASLASSLAAPLSSGRTTSPDDVSRGGVSSADVARILATPFIAAFVVERSGLITAWNCAAATALGFSEAEVVRIKYLTDLLDKDFRIQIVARHKCASDVDEFVMALMATAREDRPDIWAFQKKGGGLESLRPLCASVFDARMRVTAVIVVCELALRVAPAGCGIAPPPLISAAGRLSF
jgi:serine/threonine protein kinase